jgi:hypothetical protein
MPAERTTMRQAREVLRLRLTVVRAWPALQFRTIQFCLNDPPAWLWQGQREDACHSQPGGRLMSDMGRQEFNALEAGPTLGLHIQPIAAPFAAEFESAFSAMGKERAQAVLVLSTRALAPRRALGSTFAAGPPGPGDSARAPLPAES